MISKALLLNAFVVGAIVLAAPAHAVVVGEISDFEYGTPQGWVVNLLGMGSAPQPTVQLGGPGGATDHYLLLSSTGGAGSGSRLNMLNPTPAWSGDYIAAGLTGFSASVNNFGQSDLYLRVLFEDPGPMSPPSNIAYSTDAVFLAAGSGWTNVFFPILASDLTAGIGSIESALSGTTAIRLYHSQALSFPSPVGPGIAPVTASLGVDNFRAAIPEPSAWALMIAGFGLIGCALRRRARPGARAVT